MSVASPSRSPAASTRAGASARPGRGPTSRRTRRAFRRRPQRARSPKGRRSAGERRKDRDTPDQRCRQQRSRPHLRIPPRREPASSCTRRLSLTVGIDETARAHRVAGPPEPDRRRSNEHEKGCDSRSRRGVGRCGRTAYASIPDGNGVIHACYKAENGDLRVIDPSSRRRSRPGELQEGRDGAQLEPDRPTGLRRPRRPGRRARTPGNPGPAGSLRVRKATRAILELPVRLIQKERQG